MLNKKPLWYLGSTEHVFLSNVNSFMLNAHTYDTRQKLTFSIT